MLLVIIADRFSVFAQHKFYRPRPRVAGGGINLCAAPPRIGVTRVEGLGAVPCLIVLVLARGVHVHAVVSRISGRYGYDDHTDDYCDQDRSLCDDFTHRHSLLMVGVNCIVRLSWGGSCYAIHNLLGFYTITE